MNEDKLVKNGHHHDAIRTIHNHNHFSEDEEASESEKVQAPMVRIGVLSRSTNTPPESMEMMPPSRVQSYRVSDSSIESIRQSLREMELQLVVAQNTVAAETRAEYDLYYQSSTLVNPEKLPVMTKEDEEEENYDGKENACPVDQDTDQDIKRVLDDLQWAGKCKTWIQSNLGEEILIFFTIQSFRICHFSQSQTNSQTN